MSGCIGHCGFLLKTANQIQIIEYRHSTCQELLYRLLSLVDDACRLSEATTNLARLVLQQMTITDRCQW